MKRFLKICTLFFLLLPLALSANVVRLAPDFTWCNATDSTVTSLQCLRKSAVLIIAPNVKNLWFHIQLRELQGVYQYLAASRTLLFIAFSQNLGRVPSDIPFVIVSNGSQVADAYCVGYNKFGIAIIGRDGNLDYFSNQVIAGQRVLDIVNNSFVVQQAFRKE